MSITIVGLGAGDIDSLTLGAWRILEAAETVYLRTERHPCVPHLPVDPIYHSFDHLYESSEAFEDVYAEITRQLIDKAINGETIIYAVPGDPFVGESTPRLIQQAARQHNIDVHIVHGVSFIEPMLAEVGIDAVSGLQILDALDIASAYHPPINPEYPALLAQVYNRDVASHVKLTLMNQYPDEFEVTLIHGAGTADSSIEIMPLYEIDRSDHINHLTSLYLPALGEYTSFEAFQEIIAHLRAPEGCPWDREQTHESLRPFLIEEAYEVLEAIDNGNWDELKGELGDLMLQIVLHTQIATEYGEFTMPDVLEYVNQKMIRRHPHVWGDVQADEPEIVTRNWEQIKQAERANQPADTRESILDGIPKGTPALMVSHKYQAKSAKYGFDWGDLSGVMAKAREEFDEILSAPDETETAKEITDLIFVLVNWLRWLGNDDPESLMREANRKFYRRFNYIEQHTDKPLTEMTLDEMEALWQAAKTEGL